MLWTHFYIYFYGYIQVKCFFLQSPFSLEHNAAAGTSGSPNSVEVCWDFEYIRECMKINKIRSKFHFFKRIEIKMTPCVFVLFFYGLFTSWAIWKQFYGRLRFWVVLTIRNKGRLGTLKPNVPARSSINPIKMVQTRQNCRQIAFYASWVSDFTKTVCEVLDKNIIYIFKYMHTKNLC